MKIVKDSYWPHGKQKPYALAIVVVALAANESSVQVVFERKNKYFNSFLISNEKYP